MPRQGLTKEMLVTEAIRQIEETGLEQFSLREFAAKLDIKAASLYNHIKSLDDLKTEIGLYAIRMLGSALTQAIAGKTHDEAIRAAAAAYRSFTKEHPEIYSVILKTPKSGDTRLSRESIVMFKPLVEVVGNYGVSDADKTNFIRYFRSAVHGFASLEQAGFLKDQRVDIDESYNGMIAALILTLHGMSDDLKGSN
ncbi:MAG TPA: WHG domain-containing protein [Feifaniaceae bacterium]|nr:WHG domain-containing protein [Feifaniaceae bacterium]